MKKVLKWIGGIFAILILIGIVTSGNETKTSTGPNTPAAQQNEAATSKPTEEQPAQEENKPTITKAEFDQIKSGMTYEEVTQIIGGPGTVLSESGNPGEKLHTVIYQYEGEGSLGANANMAFQGNKLQNKAQMGLE